MSKELIVKLEKVQTMLLDAKDCHKHSCSHVSQEQIDKGTQCDERFTVAMVFGAIETILKDLRGKK